MARVKNFLGQHRCHIVYTTPAIYNQESALKWVAEIPDKKCFYVKNIVLSSGNNSHTEIPTKTFSKEQFVNQYKNENLDTISVLFNFHQYEVVFLIDLSENTVELMFPRKTMIDYKMIESCLLLDK